MYIKHYWMSCLYRVICDFLSFCVFQISCSELGSRHSIWSEKSLLSLSDQNQDKHKIFELCFSGFFAEVFIFSKSEEELASVSPARKVADKFYIWYPGLRIRFWPKTGSGALYLNRRLLYEHLDICKAFFLFSYFWCQTSSVSPRAPDPVQILTDPGWFSESRTSMECLTPKVWKLSRRLLKWSYFHLIYL